MIQPYGGRCWRFGDDLASDQLLPPQHVFEYDPKLLRRCLLAEPRPELTQQAQRSDLLVAGRNFATGSSHSHPFLAMREVGIGLICASISRGPFRLAVFMGIPLLVIGAQAGAGLNDGDRLEVDIAVGRIATRTTGLDEHVEPLSPFLLAIISQDGGLSYAHAMVETGDIAHAES